MHGARRLHRELQDCFPEHSPLLTPRGNTALYLAFSLIRRRRGGGSVLLPSTVCPSVALAAVYAGLTPQFCDVEELTFCASARTLRERLTPDCVALVVVYLFGKIPDLDGILALAREHDFDVIEDAAQAIGGRHSGQLLGSFGHYGVLSFSDVKVAPGAGGALLIGRKEEHAEAAAILASLPQAAPAHELGELATSFRNITHGIFDGLRAEGLCRAVRFDQFFGETYRPLYVHSGAVDEKASERTADFLQCLDDERSQRHQRVRLYNGALVGVSGLVGFSADEMCWRLPLLLRDHSAQLLALSNVRGRKQLISNHYFPASFLFGDDTCETARQIGLRAVNLWIDDRIDEEGILDTCRVIRAIDEDLNNDEDNQHHATATAELGA